MTETEVIGTVAEFAFWPWYWHITFLRIVPIVGIMAFLSSCYTMIGPSLKFNYFYYLRHGRIGLVIPEGGKEKKEFQSLAEELRTEDIFAAWLGALGLTVLAILLSCLAAIIWPITTIVVLPLVIVRIIGYRKRRKIIFQQKLQGTHDE